MKKLKLIFFYSLMMVAVSFSKVSAQQVFKTTSTSTALPCWKMSFPFGSAMVSTKNTVVFPTFWRKMARRRTTKNSCGRRAALYGLSRRFAGALSRALNGGVLRTTFSTTSARTGVTSVVIGCFVLMRMAKFWTAIPASMSMVS